uniref:Uncharacterized protein n=1 Tax=Oryza brachyantha TaxID=4533 RepID=J3MQL3_ORYBR
MAWEGEMTVGGAAARRQEVLSVPDQCAITKDNVRVHTSGILFVKAIQSPQSFNLP